jgi:phage host-nuclease inhibitor protein Gam
MANISQLASLADRTPPAAPDLPEEPEYVDPENPEITSGSRTRGPWRIEDESAAEWALQKKGEAEAEIARVLRVAEARKADLRQRIAAIDARVAEIVRGQQRRATFMEAAILEWMHRARALVLKGKAKSRKFLHGTIGWKASPRKLVYDDEKAALAWARAQGVDAGLVRVEFLLEKDALKRYCAAHDVLPAGAHWEGGQDRPFVEAELALAVPANDTRTEI